MSFFSFCSRKNSHFIGIWVVWFQTVEQKNSEYFLDKLEASSDGSWNAEDLMLSCGLSVRCILSRNTRRDMTHATTWVFVKYKTSLQFSLALLFETRLLDQRDGGS